MIDFSILIPTRGRPALLRRCLESIRDTASNPGGVEILLYVDEDDFLTRAFSFPGLKILKCAGPRATLGEMPRVLEKSASGRNLFLFNDDARILTAGWDEKMLRVLAPWPDGAALAWPRDPDRDGRLATFPCLPRTACALMGGIVPAPYRRHFSDNHVMDVFLRLRSLGHARLAYAEDVLVDHMTYGEGLAALEGEDASPGDEDDKLLFERLAPEREETARRLAAHIRSRQAAAGESSLLR